MSGHCFTEIPIALHAIRISSKDHCGILSLTKSKIYFPAKAYSVIIFSICSLFLESEISFVKSQLSVFSVMTTGIPNLSLHSSLCLPPLSFTISNINAPPSE